MPKPDRQNAWRAIAAASVGNALEFYDLLIYGYFAATLGKAFFPAINPTTSLLLSVATFGVSYVARPFGAVILGAYADKAGRKAALTITINLMLVGTALLVLAPTYAQIGIFSPLIVVFARLLQGFSAGGEFGAATAFMVEHADAKRRGFFASWQSSTQGMATILAAGLSAWLSYILSPAQLDAWGWRIAFGVGLLIGPVGLYIRRGIDETPEFAALSVESKAGNALKRVWADDRRALLLGIAIVAGVTAFNYVHKLYMATYATETLHIAMTSSFLGALATGIILTVMAPIFGLLSDRIGRYRVLGTALAVAGLTSLPIFLALNAWPTTTTLLVVQVIVGFLIAATLGPTPAILADLFPPRTRGTGLAVSYNFSVTLFGGFAPLVITSLIAVTGNTLMPAFYVIAIILVSFIAVVTATRNADRTPGCV
ncbi:MFS transporter [Sphingomonas sp. PAMC 26617]|uniref:MFS transporter n=1 Tax=Sphingomonas sp. PAMC 26617 TaxID=1112216 RepID=UPI0002889A58|nr:MFS transporter [Sphingomonas sp. PAMC 26617]